MKRVFIGVGHGGSDPGATANGLRESDVNLIMALAMQRELLRHNVLVGISRISDENDSLAEEIAEAKAFNPDVAVECHNNAGGGDGFEIFVQTNQYAESSKRLAAFIEDEVKKIGQNSRGIKTKLNASGTDHFGWLRQTNGVDIKQPFCTSVLCEGAFLDNKIDAQIIDTTPEQDAFGVAYAKGVLCYLGIAWIEPQADAGTWSLQIITGSKKTVENYAKQIAAEGTKIGGKAVQTYIWQK